MDDGALERYFLCSQVVYGLGKIASHQPPDKM